MNERVSTIRWVYVLISVIDFGRPMPRRTLQCNTPIQKLQPIPHTQAPPPLVQRNGKPHRECFIEAPNTFTISIQTIFPFNNVTD